MQEIVKSQSSNDSINLFIIKKSHKTIVNIITVDESEEHVKLIFQIIDKLKNLDIKWIEIKVYSNPIIPKNTISYKNKYNNNYVCHIEDFEKFYFSNIKNIIQLTHIHYSIPKQTEDGWIQVNDNKKEKNKEKRDKYNKITNELCMLFDWTSF